MFGMKRRAADRAATRAAELGAVRQAAHGYLVAEWGQETSQRITNAVDEIMGQLVKPWADNMVDIFTKKVAVKVIFCDDGPEQEARFSLAEFNQAVDDHLEEIRPDVRAHLSSYEQLSRKSNALDEYKMLLVNRFDTLRQNLTMSATEIARCVVTARKEEMGLDAEEGEHLTNGRRILKEVRAMPVSLNDEQKETLKTCLRLLEQGTS